MTASMVVLIVACAILTTISIVLTIYNRALRHKVKELTKALEEWSHITEPHHSTAKQESPRPYQHTARSNIKTSPARHSTIPTPTRPTNWDRDSDDDHMLGTALAAGLGAVAGTVIGNEISDAFDDTPEDRQYDLTDNDLRVVEEPEDYNSSSSYSSGDCSSGDSYD